MEPSGAYTADRAAGLSGVPRSTIEWWARKQLVVPSVSATPVKLWSFTDLIALRTTYWLRRRKTTNLGVDIPAASIGAVRQALNSLSLLNYARWKNTRPTVLVDGGGNVYLDIPGGVQRAEGQVAADALLDPIAPFSAAEGLRGPDLQRPRKDIRIVPSKLSGSPHVVGTRVDTRSLAGLARDGYDTDEIAALYPYLDRGHIAQALDLEDQLNKNRYVSQPESRQPR